MFSAAMDWASTSFCRAIRILTRRTKTKRHTPLLLCTDVLRSHTSSARQRGNTQHGQENKPKHNRPFWVNPKRPLSHARTTPHGLCSYTSFGEATPILTRRTTTKIHKRPFSHAHMPPDVLHRHGLDEYESAGQSVSEPDKQTQNTKRPSLIHARPLMSFAAIRVSARQHATWPDEQPQKHTNPFSNARTPPHVLHSHTSFSEATCNFTRRTNHKKHKRPFSHARTGLTRGRACVREGPFVFLVVNPMRVNPRPLQLYEFRRCNTYLNKTNKRKHKTPFSHARRPMFSAAMDLMSTSFCRATRILTSHKKTRIPSLTHAHPFMSFAAMDWTSTSFCRAIRILTNSHTNTQIMSLMHARSRCLSQPWIGRVRVSAGQSVSWPVRSTGTRQRAV